MYCGTLILQLSVLHLTSSQNSFFHLFFSNPSSVLMPLGGYWRNISCIPILQFVPELLYTKHWRFKHPYQNFLIIGANLDLHFVGWCRLLYCSYCRYKRKIFFVKSKQLTSSRSIRLTQNIHVFRLKINASVGQ